ncbi:Oidioi.mRNA.OKI2018_I69.chr2.g7137.t1.cds [Oikopleura dioica]|uniref:Oidioi.mRNA.OKI2018_I69.chr2.g7137.t1.cds n=1 Tax=Oikopleura dioica TaxID=34765 RepID=A0ABN7T5N6_OIKDI|nr:Oidioi.mRNA.OKI2018_I69.chr2.g7137.t1.cds [Oikopleura dioica]
MSKIDLEVLYKQAERPSLATSTSKPFWDTIEWNDSREVKLQYYVSDESFGERIHRFFFKNTATSATIRLFMLCVRVILVLVYFIRAGLDTIDDAYCCKSVWEPNYNENSTCKVELKKPDQSRSGHETFDIQWAPIFLVCRPYSIWILEVIFTYMTLVYSIMISILNNGFNTSAFLSLTLLLECIISLPLVLSSMLYYLRVAFVPTFLHIWLGRTLVNETVNFMQRDSRRSHSTIFYKIVQLVMSVLCIFVTCLGFVNHFERAGANDLNLLDTFWFVVVTFSTVGYGDVSPKIWPSKLIVILMIFLALVIIPIHVEQIAVIYLEQQRLVEYRESRKHVVLCTTDLQYDDVVVFLHEFYEVDEHAENYSVVLFCAKEPDAVTLIIGSTYRSDDLLRAKLNDALAVFICTDRTRRGGILSRAETDEHTVLRSMAIKDFAPSTKLFVQCLRSESTFYLGFADNCLCDDEMKYALLALNCDIPGMSTFITLLIHTTKGLDDDIHGDWKVHLNRSAGMEIYDVIASESKFFNSYIGYSFPQASCVVHRKTGAILIAVERDGKLKLNPGQGFYLGPEDRLYYVCLTDEGDSAFIDDNLDDLGEINTTKMGFQSPRNTKISPDADGPKAFQQNMSEWTEKIDNSKSDLLGECKHDFPPCTPYLGYITPTLCYIRKEPASVEEMLLGNVWEKTWPASHIIVSAEEAQMALYNFIIPLRAYYRSVDELRPIVLLLEEPPSQSFLDCISWFPLVYYQEGSCTSVDDLLKSGILWAHSVIILNRDPSTDLNYMAEEHMADSKQLIATETICRLFPAVNVSLELSYASNMRFMNFSLQTEKEDAVQGTNELSYLFRGPFASGRAFCSSMLDALLYQSFTKPYLPKLLRLLLGLQFEPGSGFMGTVTVTEREASLNYSQLFKILTQFTGEIPLGIYRNEKRTDFSRSSGVHKTNSDRRFSARIIDAGLSIRNKFRRSLDTLEGAGDMLNSHNEPLRLRTERDQLNNLIEQRTKYLKVPSEKMEEATYRQGKQNSANSGRGFVIINPEPNLPLIVGDIIYTIKPINQKIEADVLATHSEKSS